MFSQKLAQESMNIFNWSSIYDENWMLKDLIMNMEKNTDLKLSYKKKYSFYIRFLYYYKIDVFQQKKYP